VAADGSLRDRNTQRVKVHRIAEAADVSPLEAAIHGTYSEEVWGANARREASHLIKIFVGVPGTRQEEDFWR
jgi:hypothetical protein